MIFRREVLGPTVAVAVATKSGPLGLRKGPLTPLKVAFWAKWGPFGAPGSHQKAQNQVKVCGNHEFHSVGQIGGTWDQIWPPRTV